MEPPSPHNPSFPHLSSPTQQTFSSRRAALSPEFRAKLAQMSLRLAPLVQLTSGNIHPCFPRSLLSFWLLTEPQLDSLAHFYHQRTPCQWTAHYPCPVSWSSDLSIEEKRRRLGRFIGLRGCETPTVAANTAGAAAASIRNTTATSTTSGSSRRESNSSINEQVFLIMNRTEEEVERDARLAREREQRLRRLEEEEERGSLMKKWY